MIDSLDKRQVPSAAAFFIRHVRDKALDDELEFASLSRF